jgi:hypothetical protein
MRFGKFPIILTCLIMPLVFSSAQTPPESGTGIEGVITITPIHPGPAVEGVPNSGPLANATFVAENEKGVTVSFTTDDQGRFRVSLPPGHYTILAKERGVRHCGGWKVDVVAGKMTNVEWQCDTGMR